MAQDERALAVDDGLAWAHYGRGIALTMMGNTQEALVALQVAARGAPWLPDLDARLAELLIGTGQLELAWEHALKAHTAGSDVEDVFRRLQELAPREADLSEQTTTVSVRLQAGGGGDLLTRTVAPLILAAAGKAIWNSPLMFVAGETDKPDLILRLRIDRVRRKGTGYSMSGWLVLTHSEGHELREVRLNVTDVDAVQQRDATVAVAFEQIENAVSAYLRR